MPSYRIPSDDRIRDSLVRVLSTRPMVDSQRRLKQLIEKDLKGDEKYRVGEPRLRHLAIESGLVDLEIRCRDTEEMRSLIKCPVCGVMIPPDVRWSMCPWLTTLPGVFRAGSRMTSFSASWTRMPPSYRTRITIAS